jgi:RNA polymerase sigma-70 factor, ECF subfamily
MVDLYGPLVFRWCVQSGLAPADASDVMQDVFLAAWLGLDRFEHRGGTFRGWLRVITRNKLHDYHRRIAEQAPAEGGTEVGQRFANLPFGSDPTSASSEP